MKPLPALPRHLAPWFTALALVGAALLSGCGHAPPAPPAQALLDDRLFAPPREPVDRSAIFQMSPEMRQYAAQLKSTNAQRDLRRVLIDALYKRELLRLNYDATSTRNAAEAFEARSGNCLSLVIMTAAFAKHLGLEVSYRNVLLQETYSRTADLLLANGHINIVLERLPARVLSALTSERALVVDFLPPDEGGGGRSLPLQEKTVVAMFLNNRAAEALTAGRIDDAYAWAREAVIEDPGFVAAINTLAVIYMRGGHLAQAEAALQHGLRLSPDSTASLSNLRSVLVRAGRHAEAQTVAQRLAALQPYPPFHFLDLGRRAMSSGDYTAARDLFARELRRQPYQHEVHFWAAQADWALGEHRQALAHLSQARDFSLTLGQQQLYGAKLDKLRSQGLR